jgi:hypothetical protein
LLRRRLGRIAPLGSDGHFDERKAVCEVVSVAGNQSDAGSITTRQNAEAVMLDFVHPPSA